MSSSPSDMTRVRLSTAELCDTLGRIRGLNEELLETLSDQEQALVDVETDSMVSIRKREEKLIVRIIEEEKERLLLT